MNFTSNCTPDVFHATFHSIKINENSGLRNNLYDLYDLYDQYFIRPFYILYIKLFLK